MKNQLVVERIFQVWSYGLMALFVAGLSVAIFNLATGNYHSTASFEF